MILSFDRIAEAARLIDPAFLNSQIAVSDALDHRLDCRFLAKVETLNPIRSFKGRGAEFFAATALEPGERLICASAGNFGQGLARAATRRGHASVVYAASNANPLKIEAMRGFGAEVRLFGDDFLAAKTEAKRVAAAEGLRLVEDGAEPAIAEGAGTIGLELAAQAPDLDAVLVPVGDGALIAGVATALRRLSPKTRIVAVMAEQAPAMRRSLEAGRVIQAEAHTIADGIAILQPSPEAVALLPGLYDAVETVSEAGLVEALKLLFRSFGLAVEPSGAAGLAALRAAPERYAGQRVATILTGGNLSEPQIAEWLTPS